MRRLLLVATALACPAQAPLRFANGLTATLLEQHESALLRVEVRIPIEAADLPAPTSATHMKPRPGLPELFLRTLQAGPAGRRNAETFALALDQNGIRLSAWVDHRGLRFSLLARSRDLELAFALLADLLQRNSLEHGPLETERQRLFLETTLLTPDALSLARARTLGGPEAPPTEESLSSFTLDELLAFRARVLRPDRARFVVAGDLTPAQARQALQLSLGVWTPEPQPASRTTPAAAAAGPLAPALAPWALPSGTKAALQLPIPETAAQPLLDPLLREAMPDLRGRGLPGDPWVWVVPSAEGASKGLATLQRTLQALGTKRLSAQDLARARSAWTASRSLQSLDPMARILDLLDPGPSVEEVQKVSLEGLQAVWDALFTPLR